MPKKPGAQSTRRTVKSTAGLLVGSFLMTHEDWYWRRPCVVEGCDHRMGPRSDELATWRPCSDKALPAFVVKESAIDDTVGIACPCHVAEILDRD